MPTTSSRTVRGNMSAAKPPIPGGSNAKKTIPAITVLTCLFLAAGIVLAAYWQVHGVREALKAHAAQQMASPALSPSPVAKVARSGGAAATKTSFERVGQEDFGAYRGKARCLYVRESNTWSFVDGQLKRPGPRYDAGIFPTLTAYESSEVVKVIAKRPEGEGYVFLYFPPYALTRDFQVSELWRDHPGAYNKLAPEVDRLCGPVEDWRKPVRPE